MDKYVHFDENLFELKQQIQHEAEEKMKQSDVDTDPVKQHVSE